MQLAVLGLRILRSIGPTSVDIPKRSPTRRLSRSLGGLKAPKPPASRVVAPIGTRRAPGVRARPTLSRERLRLLRVFQLLSVTRLLASAVLFVASGARAAAMATTSQAIDLDLHNGIRWRPSILFSRLAKAGRRRSRRRGIARRLGSERRLLGHQRGSGLSAGHNRLTAKRRHRPCGGRSPSLRGRNRLPGSELAAQPCRRPAHDGFIRGPARTESELLLR